MLKAPNINPNLKRILTIDFETYYSKDYGLKKYTTSAYVRDEKFEVIGVGVTEDGKNIGWFERDAFEGFCKTVDWSTTAVVAHHAHFDGLILAHHFHVKPAFWFDTLSMANLLGLSAHVGGSLAKLMKHFGVGEKGDEVLNALGKRREDFTPEEYLRYGEYCLNDCRGTWEIFCKMEPAVPPIEAAVVDFTIRAFTEPTILMDTALLKDALETELKRKEDLLARVLKDREQLSSNKQFAALLIDAGLTEIPTKISPATGEETYAFAKSDPGMKALLEHPEDAIRWLAEARIGVKSTIAESRIGRMLTLVKGNLPAPIYLKVAAAHTQRWGGGDKTNFQNLPRGGPIRKSIMAPAGHVLVACDSAQIEARGLAWFAGEEELLAAFRNKRDVYSEFASVAYGRHVDRKKNPDDEIPGFVGKVCVLGLGYGMGWRKLSITLLAGAMGGKPVQFAEADALKLGIDADAFQVKYAAELAQLATRLTPKELAIHCAVSKSLVDTYRQTNRKIWKSWDQLNEVVGYMDATWGVGVGFGPGNAFKVERHAILRPSGLRLKYPGLSQRDNGWTYMGGAVGKEPTKIYGGSFAENMVQAFCRDIIAHQAAVLRWDYGYKIVTTTHDEIVICVPKEDAEEAEKNVLNVMRQSPAWCTDLPLNAEAKTGERYSK